VKWGLIGVRAGLWAGVTGLAACSSAAKLQGQGGACLTTDDCRMGLVCLLDAGVCSNDLNSLVHVEDAAAKADAPGDAATDVPAADAPIDDAALPDDAPAPTMDSGATDAGQPPADGPAE